MTCFPLAGARTSQAEESEKHGLIELLYSLLCTWQNSAAAPAATRPGLPLQAVGDKTSLVDREGWAAATHYSVEYMTAAVAFTVRISPAMQGSCQACLPGSRPNISSQETAQRSFAVTSITVRRRLGNAPALHCPTCCDAAARSSP